MDNPEARVVEGSNGLLLEIDGEIVPNYDATFRTIEEGEVVTGKVVRIDKDEVLVDIGYKSEGVIPAGELSIRKSIDPKDEVHLGELVALDGFVSARRLRPVDGSGPYVAIYEIEGDNLQAILDNMIANAGQLHMSKVLDTRAGDGVLLFVDLDRNRVNMALAALQVRQLAPAVLA